MLEYWSQLNNVFDFVRVEDIAYDKRPGMGNVVYVVDSGRGTAPAEAPFFGPGLSTNGRVWKMVFDPNDPTKVTSLSIVVEGDDNPVKTLNEVHQPDNIETTQTGLLLTEDPGSSQQFGTPVKASRTRPRRGCGTSRSRVLPQVVVKVDQSSDGDVGYDVDGRTDGAWGAWETTGIVDASAAFGPGAFLINVQAHTLWVERRPGTDTFPPDRTRLHVQARRRTAAAAPHPRDLAAAHEHVRGRPSGRPSSFRGRSAAANERFVSRTHGA